MPGDCFAFRAKGANKRKGLCIENEPLNIQASKKQCSLNQFTNEKVPSISTPLFGFNNNNKFAGQSLFWSRANSEKTSHDAMRMEKQYKDSYVQFFGSINKTFSKPLPKVDTPLDVEMMDEGNVTEGNVTEGNVTEGNVTDSSPHIDQSNAVTPPRSISPQLCKEYISAGYSPRTVFSYCRPSACLYPYDAAFY